MKYIHDKIRKITSGGTILTENGDLYRMGYDYMIGNGQTAGTIKSSPELVSNHKFIDVIAHYYQCFALKSDGTVWGWGRGPGLPSSRCAGQPACPERSTCRGTGTPRRCRGSAAGGSGRGRPRRCC